MNTFKINSETLEFDLPDDRIAQAPAHPRDSARLMVIDRQTGKIEHDIFAGLDARLSAGDVLVINQTLVNKAKLIGKKKTGGRVEVLFVAPTATPAVWRALVRPFMKDGTEFTVGKNFNLKLVGRNAIGECLVESKDIDPAALMEQSGMIPLPPYIKRAESDDRTPSDEREYQTVYAQTPGSIAAPTAGLHFTPELLSRLEKKGIEIIKITLHVGWGTFKPVAGTVASHEMLAERYSVAPEAFEKLRRAKKENRRIISVGTTSTRVLESLPFDATTEKLSGETAIFIKPGYQFAWLSGLITNFHVPRSTPVALTAAFAGLNNLEVAYAEAIVQKYRFYSYGDAMLIL